MIEHVVEQRTNLYGTPTFTGQHITFYMFVVPRAQHFALVVSSFHIKKYYLGVSQLLIKINFYLSILKLYN